MKGAMKPKIILSAVFISLAMLFTFVNTSYAIVLFEQTPDVNLFGHYSNSGAAIVADQFVLEQNSTITDVHWYGYYEQELAPEVTSLNFQIRFYEEAMGLPSTLLYDEIVSASIVDSGLIETAGEHAGITIYEFTADPINPIDIMGGEIIWLAISESDAATPGSGSTQWLWNRNSLAAGTTSARMSEFIPGDTWAIRAGNFAYSLTGTPVIPEPSSFLLLGSGVFGAFLRRRRS